MSTRTNRKVKPVAQARDATGREVLLRLTADSLSNPPTTLTVNGFIFKRVSFGPETIYSGPSQGRISFFSLDYGEGSAPPAIPRELTVSGRRFIRRCETYFLPLDATAEDVELLFDFMAPLYDTATDIELNALVSRYLLEEGLRGIAPGDARVLDFGCGVGTTWRQLTHLKTTQPSLEGIQLCGCDLSREMVSRSRQIGFSRVTRCQYAKTAFESSSFDLIIAAFVMHYFVDAAPLREIRRILKPGGLFIASLPTAEHQDLGEHRDMCISDPELREIQISCFETHASKPRNTRILRCRKASQVGDTGKRRSDPETQAVS